MTAAKSPKITLFAWGIIEIEGIDGKLRDAKLYPGGARFWDWRETGTHHDPGIQIADVEELLQHGATVVVLSKGVHERLKTMPETLAYLQERGVEAYVLQSEDAVKRYNKLTATHAVGALIHSTC